ncbi:hypothetical protein CPB84DRAFT_1848139 [Gymnopilus junonius]|uniref:AB hydrolase-1 domain-containing protein n=1 Tax=Gymnopilus junonius TaxID=109634 RepID=A0A9P5TMD7_GYMJU|nr:hypothetical protein CPB84DRAFT_1848139 [Gymnopilus junonius]
MSAYLKKIQSAVLSAFSLLFLSEFHVLAQANFNWTSISGSSNLSWVDCYSPPIQCTRLNVPFNYSDPSAEEATLALIRIPSTLNGTADYRGPVLFNPGGPGSSGVDFIVQTGTLVAAAIGQEFDLVSISNSVPLISFFETDAERAAFDLSSEATDSTAAPGILPSQWAHFQIFGHLAQDRDTAGFLPHVTTDNVARDMLTIVEAHGETMLKYWGISYGTVLGATFASMFPDKVERLIIDGVLDMEGYFATDWSTQLLDTDKLLQEFINAISKNIDALYQQVLAQPAVAYSPSEPQYGTVDHTTLKNAIFSSFYTPFSSFAPLAQGLADLKSGNGSVLFQLSFPHVSEVVAAVACGDGQAVTEILLPAEVL